MNTPEVQSIQAQTFLSRIQSINHEIKQGANADDFIAECAEIRCSIFWCNPDDIDIILSHLEPLEEVIFKF